MQGCWSLAPPAWCGACHNNFAAPQHCVPQVDYMEDPLVTNPGFRMDLLSRICGVGADIETALGSAQDIEGVVAPDGSITVVQTRPQV